MQRAIVEWNVRKSFDIRKRCRVDANRTIQYLPNNGPHGMRDPLGIVWVIARSRRKFHTAKRGDPALLQTSRALQR